MTEPRHRTFVIPNPAAFFADGGEGSAFSWSARIPACSPSNSPMHRHAGVALFVGARHSLCRAECPDPVGMPGAHPWLRAAHRRAPSSQSSNVAPFYPEARSAARHSSPGSSGAPPSRFEGGMSAFCEEIGVLRVAHPRFLNAARRHPLAPFVGARHSVRRAECPDPVGMPGNLSWLRPTIGIPWLVSPETVAPLRYSHSPPPQGASPETGFPFHRRAGFRT
jgi:hypothetical protein